LDLKFIGKKQKATEKSVAVNKGDIMKKT